MNTQDLRVQRAQVWEKAKALLDESEAHNRDFTAEEAASWEKYNQDLDQLGDRIERAERAQAVEGLLGEVDRSAIFGRGAAGGDGAAILGDVDSREGEYARVFDSWLRGGMGAVEDASDRRILQAGFRQDAEIRNAAGVGTGAAGGFTVPPGFRQKFVEVMKYFGPMLQVAEVIDTDNGANLQWPTNDDTGNVGAILGENVQVAEQDVTLGSNSLDAYMYTSKLVRVSLQLIQDSAFDFPVWLQRKLGERVGRILNAHFTTGTGTAQPDGIVTSATVGVTGTGSFATTGGFQYDNIVDLIESLDPAYGADPDLRFMLHQTARKAFRKVKDTQNRPLWEPSVQAGVPDSILGYPYVINNDMPTLATSSKSVLFGNIRQAYVIRLVTGLALLQLNERYADFLQRGYLGFQRADGTMQDANAVRVFQTTATA